MLKAKKLDITQTNIAHIGSDLDKKVRQAAGAHEDAWKNVGKSEGIEIFRIENFAVKKWARLGEFYDGDSYIVVKTRKNKDGSFFWDIHFWLGKYTSQDEAGVAAYKTVELDDFLGGAPVQHREVDGFESETFASYFTPPGIRIMHGGVDSGFNKVKPEEYKPRLLHIKGTAKCVRVHEVKLSHQSLNSGDAFILDLGLHVIQWMGKGVSVGERTKATQLARALDDERGGKVKIDVFAEGDTGLEEFWKHLGGEGPVKSAEEGGDDKVSSGFSKKLFRLSDATGSLVFTEVADGSIPRAKLDAADAFILDAGPEVFVWLGKNSSTNERKGALQYAQDYLVKYNRPPQLPITRILQGAENEVFNSFLV